jgi:hypothetical protein
MINLALEDEPFAIQSLPILDAATQGTDVGLWPVVWPDDSTTSTTVDSTLPAIAYGQTLDGVIPDNGTLTWTFTGTAGDTVTLGTVSDDSALDLYIRVLGPDGVLVTENDDDGPGLNPLIEGFVLPVNGVYTIEVKSLGPGGSFQLGLASN